VPGAGRIVLGGTFDHLHVGHEALLGAAFRAGRRVAIGLTSEAFLRARPKPGAERLQPYPARRRALARWLAKRYPRSRWTIVPISDAFGGSTGAGVRALVVSAETVGGGRAVNAERVRLGRRPVPVLVVPLVLADDLRPVSSRRIRSGEIDPAGRRRTAIRLGLSVGVPADAGPARRGVRRAFRRAIVRVVRPKPRGRVPMRTALRAALAGAEIAVAVRPAGADRREIALASREVALPARTVRAPSPRRLEEAIASMIRPPGRPKRFRRPGR
jgi:pantetheine-phosphate adenylyltransferase